MKETRWNHKVYAIDPKCGRGGIDTGARRTDGESGKQIVE